MTDTAYIFPNLWPGGMTKQKVVWILLFFHKLLNFGRAGIFLCQKWWRISNLCRNSISWAMWFAKQLPIKSTIVCMWPAHVTRDSVTEFLQPKQIKDRRRNRGTKCILWPRSTRISGRARTSRLHVSNLSLKFLFSSRKILAERKNASHNHNVSGKHTSCSPTEKVKCSERAFLALHFVD